ncbi:unnamed protein product, partial [Scytosiphon promiscuus]
KRGADQSALCGPPMGRRGRRWWRRRRRRRGRRRGDGQSFVPVRRAGYGRDQLRSRRHDPRSREERRLVERNCGRKDWPVSQQLRRSPGRGGPTRRRDRRCTLADEHCCRRRSHGSSGRCGARQIDPKHRHFLSEAASHHGGGVRAHHH